MSPGGLAMLGVERGANKRGIESMLVGDRCLQDSNPRHLITVLQCHGSVVLLLSRLLGTDQLSIPSVLCSAGGPSRKSLSFTEDADDDLEPVTLHHGTAQMSRPLKPETLHPAPLTRTFLLPLPREFSYTGSREFPRTSCLAPWSGAFPDS